MATTFTLRRKLFATTAIAGKSIAGMVQKRGASTMTKIAPGVKAKGDTLGGKARTDYSNFWANADLGKTNSVMTDTVLGTATKGTSTRTITTGNATKSDLKRLGKSTISPQYKPKRTSAPTYQATGQNVINLSAAPSSGSIMAGGSTISFNDALKVRNTSKVQGWKPGSGNTSSGNTEVAGSNRKNTFVVNRTTKSDFKGSQSGSKGPGSGSVAMRSANDNLADKGTIEQRKARLSENQRARFNAKQQARQNPMSTPQAPTPQAPTNPTPTNPTQPTVQKQQVIDPGADLGLSKQKRRAWAIAGTLGVGYGIKKIDDAANGHD